MKSFIAIPLVLAGASAEADILSRLENLNTIHPEAKAKFDLKAGASCAEGYEPLTSSWQDCSAAARSMGFEGEDVAYVKYNKPWGTRRPQGCFRKGNGEFHFNDGAGGDFKGKDRILCVLNGQGVTAAGSSLESDIVLDNAHEEAGPEGSAPPPLVDIDLDYEDGGGSVTHVLDAPPTNELISAPPTNETFTDFAESAFTYRSYEEGLTNESSVARKECGVRRNRIYSTTREPFKWIVSMDVKFPRGSATCTGFFISKRAIMTAAHCIYEAKYGGWAKSVVACPGRNGNSYPYGCQYAHQMWTVNNYIRYGKIEDDYAMFVLPNNAMYDRGVGYFGYSTNLSNVWRVNAAGYPGDKDDATTLWHTYSSYWTDRWGSVIRMEATATGGQSGGPVWASFRSSGQRRVVGLLTNGGCPISAKRITSGVYDWMNHFRRHYN